VRRDLLGALRLLVVPTLALVAVAVIFPGRAGLAVRVYALILAATALALVLVALRRAFPPERPLRDSRRARRARRSPPASLDRIENEAALGVAGSFDLHFRLVPRLRSIAGGLLASRRRLSLETQTEAAHALLGDITWELVRPDRQAPDDRLARGLEPDDLDRVVEALEGV
jgi:hypothetical protein